MNDFNQPIAPIMVLPYGHPNHQQQGREIPIDVSVAIQFVGMVHRNILHPVAESSGMDVVEIRPFRGLSLVESEAYDSALCVLDDFFHRSLAERRKVKK